MERETPRQLGAYTLLRLLGEGGMAEVWLARHAGPLGARRLVVVKRILPHQARQRTFVEAFVDEARLTCRLQHPNIVQVLEVGTDGDRPFLALELVDGLDLERLWHELARHGRRLPIGVATRIAIELLRALAYAHALADEAGQPLGVVHRDISPPNVLLGRSGEVKLADFGIARARGRLSKTAYGLVKGKAAYMSPEQAAGQSLDHRSDLFAVGVLLWESLTGHRLFDAGDDFVTMRRVRECHLEPPSSRRAEIDPALDAVVLKLLARRAEDRFANAPAAIAALEAAVGDDRGRPEELAVLVAQYTGESLARVTTPTRGLEVEPVVAIDLHRPKSARWRRWLIGAAAVATMAAVWLLLRGPAPAPPAPVTTPVDVAAASLVIHPGTAGAVAFWDGEPLAEVPVAREIPFDNRNHQLLLLRPGFVPWQRSMSFSKSRLVDQSEHLTREAGWVVPNSDGWTIAGRNTKRGQETALPAGNYLAERAGDFHLLTIRAGRTSHLP